MKAKLAWYISLWKYLSHLWQGNDGHISLKRVLAIVFSIHILRNIDYCIRKWSEGKSLADMAMVVGLELGFVAALIGISQWSSFIERKTDTISQQIPPGE